MIVRAASCWPLIAFRKNALAAATSRLALSLKSAVRHRPNPRHDRDSTIRLENFDVCLVHPPYDRPDRLGEHLPRFSASGAYRRTQRIPVVCASDRPRSAIAEQLRARSPAKPAGERLECDRLVGAGLLEGAGAAVPTPRPGGVSGPCRTGRTAIWPRQSLAAPMWLATTATASSPRNGRWPPLPAHLKARISRELDPIELVLPQLGEGDPRPERDTLLKPVSEGCPTPAAMLAQLRGIGTEIP